MAKNNLAQDIRVDLVYDLIHSFRYLDSVDKVASFLEDLMTPTEIRNLSVRLRIAKMLLNEVSQKDICIALHTSPVTTNKVNNWLSKSGVGFKEVVSKLPIKWSKPSKMPKGPVEFHLPELIAAGTEFIISSSQEKTSRKLIDKVGDK